MMEHFQNNISQCKIVKTLNTLSFTVHKVIKKGESGEIFVCMGQGQKSVLDACDLRSLGQFCNKYRYDSVLEITARDQKYFQKSQSLNTLYFTIHKYRLKF